MSRYSIHKADTQSEADRVTLIKLHAETFPWDAVYDIDDATWWLAYCGTKPVGFCALAEIDEEDGCGYLARAGVLPAHRGHGLQRRFLKLREAEARKRGWRTLVTDCKNSKPHSINNVAASGFTCFWPDKPWGLSTSTYWRKEL